MYRRKSGEAAVVSEQVEAELVVQALRLNTLSKLTFADSTRYASDRILLQNLSKWQCFTLPGLQVAIRYFTILKTDVFSTST